MISIPLIERPRLAAQHAVRSAAWSLYSGTLRFSMRRNSDAGSNPVVRVNAWAWDVWKSTFPQGHWPNH